MIKIIVYIGILLFLIVKIPIPAQNNKLNGIVVDAETQEPLAFVNITYNDKNQGTATDISDSAGKSVNLDLKLKTIKTISTGMEKGYFEPGVVINDIIKPNQFMGMGFGLFYRYGSYSFSNNSDNFAFKISMTFDL